VSERERSAYGRPVSEGSEPPRTETERSILKRAAILAALGASALVALGRFRPALALTLGAAVAIVSALWLSDVLARLAAQRARAAVRFDWKLGFKAALRYAVMGGLLFAAIRVVPAEVPWLLAGASAVVLAVAAQAVAEIRRAARGSGGSL
jgi:hypothetical protein